MSDVAEVPFPSSAWVDHIPVVWVEPSTRGARRLVLFLSGLTGTKESTLPFLQDLAAAGWVALSFDLWQHGERGTESRDALAQRVFGNFRRHAWPIIGQSALDTLRVIDWAVATLDVAAEVRMGGISMGGDIAVAAAGIPREGPGIVRVAAVSATPDWLRPGMQDLQAPGRLLDPGKPDAYARIFYDTLNPLTHLDAYAHGPAIRFVCGADDTHVPPDGALRFREALAGAPAGERVQVELIPGMGHTNADPARWWPACLDWLTA